MTIEETKMWMELKSSIGLLNEAAIKYFGEFACLNKLVKPREII